jgi:predicted ABC-type ATPase
MFAGPNGSGKSTIKHKLNKSAKWFGTYLNPDEIEAAILTAGMVETDGLAVSTDHLRAYLQTTTVISPGERDRIMNAVTVDRCRIAAAQSAKDPYLAAALTAYLRHCCVESRRTFTFETVMSHPSKIDVFKATRTLGYRNYLYFIATEDPQINVRRVANRVASGGHDVDITKIIDRYHRTMGLLPDAVRETHRAFFFDSSTPENWHFASYSTEGGVKLIGDEVPRWFRSVWEKL